MGGILGARLAHVIDRFDYYRLQPLKILAVYEGGLAIWGGLIAGGLAGWLYASRNGIPFWPLADSAAVGAILGQAIGRIGCIVNGDVAGRPTGGEWGFVYTNPGALLPRPEYFNVPTHPYPLYELLCDLLIFGILYWLFRRRLFDGAVFLAYCVLYSLVRFGLTFVREEEVWLFGLQQAQVLSIVVVVVAAYLYLYLRGRQGRQRPPGSQGPRGRGATARPTPVGRVSAEETRLAIALAAGPAGAVAAGGPAAPGGQRVRGPPLALAGLAGRAAAGPGPGRRRGGAGAERPRPSRDRPPSTSPSTPGRPWASTASPSSSAPARRGPCSACPPRPGPGRVAAPGQSPAQAAREASSGPGGGRGGPGGHRRGPVDGRRRRPGDAVPGGDPLPAGDGRGLCGPWPGTARPGAGSSWPAAPGRPSCSASSPWAR